MKYVVVTLTLLALCVVNVSYGLMAIDRSNLEWFSLLKMVENCHLVVTGRVKSMDFVYRYNVNPDGDEMPTTDVTIAVDEVIKGTPNAGEDLVTFMIEGGKGIHPETGEPVHLIVTHQGGFVVGEEILLFLGKAEGESYNKNYAHNGLYLFSPYGHRPVEDGKVNLRYEGTGQKLKGVEMPVELAVTLGKASVLDKDRAGLLENVIKALVLTESGTRVSLSSAVAADLKLKAQRIIDDNTESQTD